MSVIIIRGTANAGKTTTAGYVYNDLISMGATVISNLNDGQGDIIASVLYKGKTVVIISKGDVWSELEIKINALASYDVLIVCARTQNSTTFRELKVTFGSHIIHIENIVKQLNSSKALKQIYVNNIIAKI